MPHDPVLSGILIGFGIAGFWGFLACLVAYVVGYHRGKGDSGHGQ